MSPHDETGEASAAVAAAEAELKAAQEKLAAAKARLSDESAETPPDSLDDDAGVAGGADAVDAGPAASAATPPEPPRSPDQESGGTVPPQQPHYGYQQPYTQQSYPQQPYGQQQYTQPVVSTKDHVAAGLLAIFLGVFGVHKFYLGYNGPGFIMLAVTVLGTLLTFGLAAAVVWVISIIEGILYLTKSQSEFEQIYVFNKHEWF